jgi:hypothetical protein
MPAVDQPQFIATVPEILWELSLVFYLTFKGFKPSPILSGNTGAAGARASSSPA